MQAKFKPEPFLKALQVHPYIWAFIFCAVLNLFFFGSVGNIPDNSLWIVTLLAGGMLFLFLRKHKEPQFRWYALSVGILWITGMFCYTKSAYRSAFHFLGGCGILFLLYYFSDIQNCKRQANALLIMGTGFFLKFYYILETSVYTRQNDVEDFAVWEGHAGYMTYLMQNHHLPTEDVRDYWQFAHPPLHHLLGAFWIELNEKLFSVSYDASRESLQTLTLFYSMCIMITAYQILRHFNIDGKPLYIALGIINFHPAFILLSGSVNNDVLSIAFMMGAMLTALQWYRTPTLKNILKIAFCVGLGMMTKLTAALIAPPIALLFIIIFFKNFKSKWKDLFKQFLCFGAVCIPLGLWYPVRSWIKWKVPLLFVYPLGTDTDQYIHDKTFSERIFDFSPYQFKNVYLQWLGWDESGNPISYNEFNPLTALFKTSVFGESLNQYLFEDFPFIHSFCKCFFWLNVVIAVFAFFSMLILIFKKCSITPAEKLFFLSFYLLLIGNFYKSAANYPFVCTMNFRYITPTVIISIVFAALSLQKLEFKKLSKIAVSAVGILSLLFIFFSSAVYLTVGFCPGE